MTDDLIDPTEGGEKMPVKNFRDLDVLWIMTFLQRVEASRREHMDYPEYMRGIDAGYEGEYRYVRSLLERSEAGEQLSENARWHIVDFMVSYSLLTIVEKKRMDMAAAPFIADLREKLEAAAGKKGVDVHGNSIIK